MQKVRDNCLAIKLALENVHARITEACEKSGRKTNEVQLITVSKKQGVENIVCALDSAATHFGENYVQEATKKFASLPAKVIKPKVHLIGGLQSNKAELAVAFFDCIQSVDRISLLTRLNSVAEKRQQSIDILIQVNISGEIRKGGIAPNNLPELVERSLGCKFINLDGLMCIGSPSIETKERRAEFARLYKLRDKISRDFAIDCNELSMGMSEDYELAILEGATMVRVGSAIFGRRSSY